MAAAIGALLLALAVKVLFMTESLYVIFSCFNKDLFVCLYVCICTCTCTHLLLEPPTLGNLELEKKYTKLAEHLWLVCYH